MSAEFVDTNVLVYAHDGGAGAKHAKSIDLLSRLFEEQNGALSVQVLAEFYAVAIRKLGMTGEEAEAVITDLGSWAIHRPGHADLIRASRIHLRQSVSWWDSLIVNSAMELGCRVLWSEDFADRRRFGALTVRSPFS
jgi:predicted nucleic acid-binding protein